MNATFPSKLATAKIVTVDTSHLDTCLCGDYRQDHKDGTGPCIHNKRADLTHGFEDCQSFRLASRCEPKS